MSGRDHGATRRRTALPLPLSNEESPSFSPLKQKSRKRTRRSVWIGIALIVITASCCLLVVLVLRSREQDEHPVHVRPIPHTKTNTKEKILRDNGRLLALLYPQGLFGGYRNQVIRFLALVVHALKQDIPRILLPSVLWSTQVGNSTSYTWVPIPMDLLFDIEYWNSFYPKLPKLVQYNQHETYDCWTVEPTTNWPTNATSLAKQVVQRGFLTPIYNLSKQIALQQVAFSHRQTDLLPNVTHCQKPLAYGGGTKGGKLWNDYVKMNEKQLEIPFHAQPLVLQALRPKREWREVATQCVERHNNNAEPSSPYYIALHARVELDMMNHNCGRDMEKNLTRILDMVGNLATSLGCNGVFVAVGRSGMEHQEARPGYRHHAAHLEENVLTLNRAVANGLHVVAGTDHLVSKLVPVFECGREAMEEYYYRSTTTNPTMDYGGLVQGMINFHVATEATAFVGVRGSSYSTDIWTTRYHQGKGDTNYEYTSNGIRRLDTGGLPPAHASCKRKQGNNSVKKATADKKKK